MKIDNNTIVCAGLVIALAISLILKNENVALAIAGGLTGFITGSAIPK